MEDFLKILRGVLGIGTGYVEPKVRAVPAINRTPLNTSLDGSGNGNQEYINDNFNKNLNSALRGAKELSPNEDRMLGATNGTRYLENNAGWASSPDIVKYKNLLDKVVETYTKIPTISGRTKMLELIGPKMPKTRGVQAWMNDFMNRHENARDAVMSGGMIQAGDIAHEMQELTNKVYNMYVRKG